MYVSKKSRSSSTFLSLNNCGPLWARIGLRWAAMDTIWDNLAQEGPRTSGLKANIGLGRVLLRFLKVLKASEAYFRI